MTAPKQDTLNRHCNVEAVRTYAHRVRGWGQDELIDGLLDRDDARQKIGDELMAAADLLEQAAEATSRATRASTDAAYDRIYGQVRP